MQKEHNSVISSEMAKKGSSCIKIIIGGSSSSEEDSGSGSSDTDSEIPNNKDEESVVADADVVPTFILQPRDISKNIDLMKTVAMLMENQLQQPMKGQDKLKDLCNDIQRFPEAYQKFTSIIHQIQYLNVTTNWDSTSEESNSNLKEGNGIISKAFRSKRKSVTPQELRKRTMLKLLADVQQVFNRYQKIQNALEDRLYKFSQLIVKQSPRTQSENLLDSEEDDPQRPLLAQGANGMSLSNCLEKVEGLNEKLRKTRRSAVEVQDSIEVLHDLISWENKQAKSCDESFSGTYQCRNQNDHNQTVEVTLRTQQDINMPVCADTERSHKKVWVIFGTLVGVIFLLIAAAALSFLKFY